MGRKHRVAAFAVVTAVLIGMTLLAAGALPIRADGVGCGTLLAPRTPTTMDIACERARQQRRDVALVLGACAALSVGVLIASELGRMRDRRQLRRRRP